MVVQLVQEGLESLFPSLSHSSQKRENENMSQLTTKLSENKNLNMGVGTAVNQVAERRSSKFRRLDLMINSFSGT